MMVTGVVTAMYPIWPARIKKEIVIQVAWSITIFYMLNFFSCFFVMVSDFGRLQFAIFTINMIITAILVGWKLSAAMIIVGFYLSGQFYKFYANVDYLDLSIGSPQFVFMYSLMLVGSALIIFLKPKQEYQALTEEKNEHLNDRITSQEKQVRDALELRSQFIRNVNHEYHAPMTGITSTAETLVESYHKLDDKQRLMAAKNILESSRKLDFFESNLASLSALSNASYKLNLEQVNFSNLVHDRIEVCRKLYEENKEGREFDINIEENIIIEGDSKYLSQTLDNLIINAITYCKFGKITIDLEQFKGFVYFNIADEGVGIPLNELENIFDEFTVSSRTKTPAGGRGVGLAVCQKVIEVHGGSIKAESNGDIGATFKIVLKKY